MWFLGRSLESKILQRKSQILCERCGLLYSNKLSECSKCSGIDDSKLAILLKKRAKFRIGLGNGMLVGALIVLILMFFISSR